jgi:BASS family bile acid:Na+ symporter
MPLAIVALLAGSWRAVWAAIDAGSVIAMLAFVLAGLAIGHRLGGAIREHSTVLALSTACRHPAIALSIASANFPDQPFAGTILLYLIINALAGMPYVAWQRGKDAAAAGA